VAADFTEGQADPVSRHVVAPPEGIGGEIAQTLAARLAGEAGQNLQSILAQVWIPFRHFDLPCVNHAQRSRSRRHHGFLSRASRPLAAARRFFSAMISARRNMVEVSAR